MAANIEHQVICKIIETQDFHTVDKLKIDEWFFLSDSQTKEAFRFLRDHYHNEHTNGSVPSWDLFISRFGGFPWVYSYDTLASLCQELRRYKQRTDILSCVDEVSLVVDKDPTQAMALLRETVAQMASQHELTNDLLLANAYEKLYANYNTVANAQGVTGIPFPWEILNEDTQGMHPGQFIVLYGRPKSMKTWIALVMACFAYLRGRRVLIWSLEMTEMEILRRVACIVCQVDYDKFKKGKLDPAARDRVWQILAAIKDEELIKVSHSGHTPAMMVVNARGQSNGVSALQAKIREFRADLVIVDGMYLMRDDRQKTKSMDWKAIAHISQDLKTTAALFQIPVIGVTQANRGADKDPKKADMAELAYADAIAQDCDLCLRVTKQKDQGSHEWEIVMSIPGGRDTQLDAFVINAMAATNFGFKRAMIVDPNSPQAQQQSQQGGGNKGGKNGPSGPPSLPSWGR
jgi:KaiC/GvpD/RAD55 family RecA-like ATPase